MAITNGQQANADDFISTSAGAGDSGKVPKLNASGEIDSSFFEVDFGDGRDGNATISSPTTLTRDMYYNDLVVTSTLTTAGYRIFVKGTISGAGTIDWGTPNNGANGADGASGSAGGAGGTATGGGMFSNKAGGVGGAGTVGPSGNGGADTSGKGADDGGSDGGGGGNYAGGAVIAGGNAVNSPFMKGFSLAVLGLDVKSDLTLEAIKSAPGGGGGGGNAHTSGSPRNGGGGGGGGASGGTIFIACKNFTGTFTIKSNGGNGGNGGNHQGNASGGGGGGGGAGGNVFIAYKTKTWSGSYNLTGGTGGTAGTSSGATPAVAGDTGMTGTAYEFKAGGVI